jgi:hypothetical protein
MKKLVFSATMLLGVMGICVANYSNIGSKLPLNNHTYIVRDTVPSDTTKPKDSSFIKLR